MPAVSAPPASRPSQANLPLTVPSASDGYDDDDGPPLASLELDIRPGPGQMHTAGRAMAQLSGVGLSDVPSSPPSGLSMGGGGPRSSPGFQLQNTPPPVSRPGSTTGRVGHLSSGGMPAVTGGGISSYERTEDAAHSFADYGDPPASFWLSPLYALRVHSRRAEIARELGTRQEDFTQAKKAIEDALVSLAGRARRLAEPISTYRGPLTAITAAEELLRTRDGQLSSSMDAQNRRVGDVDARISVLEEKLASALTEQKRLEAELRAVQAKIERRTAQDAAARGTGTGSGGRDSRRPGR